MHRRIFDYIRMLLISTLPYIGGVGGGLLLASCGPDGKHSAIDGRFLQMNQGEFRVYSPDGFINGIDTIHVAGGRFDYETECSREGLIVVVLPNNTELPVFVKPGKTITMRADATSIKDVEITGTDANEEMTKWRKANYEKPELAQRTEAEKFVAANPASIVSQWMVYRYIINVPNPDYRKAVKLLGDMQKALEAKGKKNDALMAWTAQMLGKVRNLSAVQVGDKLPSFFIQDVYGREVSYRTLTQGYAIITLFTSYNYEGQNINRQLKRIVEGRNLDDDMQGIARPKVLSIALEPSPKQARDMNHRDSLPWQVVCDGKMWESPIVTMLGLHTVPDNILLKDGKVIARRLTFNEIVKKLK